MCLLHVQGGSRQGDQRYREVRGADRVQPGDRGVHRAACRLLKGEGQALESGLEQRAGRIQERLTGNGQRRRHCQDRRTDHRGPG